MDTKFDSLPTLSIWRFRGSSFYPHKLGSVRNASYIVLGKVRHIYGDYIVLQVKGDVVEVEYHSDEWDVDN